LREQVISALRNCLRLSLQLLTHIWRPACCLRAGGLSPLTGDSDGEPEMAREILRYFLRNPQAADSFEGVARWRLIEEVVRRRVEGTHKALGWLVRHGFLREVSTAGTVAIFRLNPERQAEAERFLKSATAGRIRTPLKGRADRGNP
jgi:hypothetical protein